MDNDHTISKFDWQYGQLQGGNNLETKPTTVEHAAMTGEAETFIVQTIRNEKGDNIILKFMDKDGNKRLILPPKVAQTIARQKDALTARSRSIASKAVAKARKDRGELPGFMQKKGA